MQAFNTGLCDTHSFSSIRFQIVIVVLRCVAYKLATSVVPAH